MISPGNQTHYEISSPTFRGILATWCYGTGTFAIAGNIIVLIASLRFNAIKLDKVSGTLVEGIAIADILYSIFVILQVGVSLTINGWQYAGAPWTCKVSTYLQHSLALTDILLICALNISKLAVIKFPLSARAWTRRHGLIFSGVAVALANTYPVMAAYRDAHFDWRCYRCAYSTVEGVWVWLGPLCISLFLLLPNLIVILTTGALLYYVKKVSGEHRQAVMTLVPVSIVYIVSYAPIGIYFVTETGLETGHNYSSLNRYGMMIKFLNNSVNPVIYFITLRSFREFILRLCGAKGYPTLRSGISKKSKGFSSTINPQQRTVIRNDTNSQI